MAEEVDREIGEVNGTAPDGEHHRLARVSMPHITNNLVLPAEQPSKMPGNISGRCLVGIFCC